MTSRRATPTVAELIAAAKADAWDEGQRAGWDAHWRSVNPDKSDGSTRPPNPYRSGGRVVTAPEPNPAAIEAGVREWMLMGGSDPDDPDDPDRPVLVEHMTAFLVAAYPLLVEQEQERIVTAIKAERAKWPSRRSVYTLCIRIARGETPGAAS